MAEYNSVIWWPHLKQDIESVEKCKGASENAYRPKYLSYVECRNKLASKCRTTPLADGSRMAYQGRFWIHLCTIRGLLEHNHSQITRGQLTYKLYNRNAVVILEDDFLIKALLMFGTKCHCLE